MENDELLNKKKELADKFRSSKDYFVILGDDTRIQIICMILKSSTKEMSVNEITKNLYLSRPAVSHHLKALKDFGILKMREDKSTNYYYLDPLNPIWEDLVSLFIDVKSLVDEYKEKNH